MAEVDPDIASAIVTLLSDNVDVVSMVADRINPLSAEQDDDIPYIAYMLEDEESPMTQDGEASLTKSDFVIWCVGDNYAAAKRLSNFVRVAIVGFRGVVGVHTVAGIFPQTKRDVPIPPREGKERAENEVAARYRITWYQSPASIGAS